MITPTDGRGETPLEEGSARRKNLYLTTHDSRRDKHPCPRRDSNPKPQQASGQTHALDCATTGIDLFHVSAVANSDLSVTHCIGALEGELPGVRGVDNSPERKIMVRVRDGH
jgi:hypothetical protein